MVTHFLQRSRSILSSLVQTILTSVLMLYQNTFRKPTSIKHAFVCCFCMFTLTRSHKYSNVSRVTLKCSFQIKLSPGLAIKYRSQFCGRGQTPSSPLSVLLIHMGHNHQQQHLPVSPPNSEFFLHNVKVIKLEKQSSLTLQ